MNDHHIETTITLQDITFKVHVVLLDGEVHELRDSSGDKFSQRVVHLINKLVTNREWLERIQGAIEDQKHIYELINKEVTK